MADVLNTLGQTVLPKVFDKLQGAGLADTMTVKRKSATAGTGGGRIKNATADTYTLIPVDISMASPARRVIQGDRPLSTVQYKLTFPTHDTSSTPVRYAVDIETDRLVVDARGNEPAKTFRMLAIPEDHGVVYEAICEKES